MSKKEKEYTVVMFIVISTFFLLLYGYYTSPSFSQEQRFIEAMGVFISFIFSFSVIVILSFLGFNSFAIFLAIFLTMAISLYGAEAGIIVIIIGYFIWGLGFAIEILLVHNGSSGAVEWFKRRYTKKSFEMEYLVFYPVLWIFYFLFDVVPHYTLGDERKSFNPEEIKNRLIKSLK
jgi:hypothetical protein